MVRASDSYSDVYGDCDKPPLATEELVEIFRGWRDAGNHWDEIPRAPLDAANWWIEQQEPRRRGEDPVRKQDGRGQFIGWQSPYNDRLANTLRIFLGLSTTARLFVMEHIAQGIPWRGDSMPQYKMIIEQHQEMQKNPERYKHLAELTRKEVTNGNKR